MAKESNKVPSVTKVSSLTEFVKWADKIGKGNMLFRGLANADWGVESSLYRRLMLSGLKKVESDIFLEMTRILISRACKEGYDIETIRKLNDLELLAKLQHHGAATCLIDFTKNSFIALCFACESVYNKTGKVVAFNSDNADLYNEITKDTDKEIGYWLTEYEKNKKLWILSPKKLNNRIASQQSVFVFGSPTLSTKNFQVCKITNKESILEELKKNGISAEVLFDDYVGFSALNSHNKKYENWDTDSDFVSGRIFQALGDYESAIKYYDKVIKSNPQDLAAYNNRGIAKYKLGKFQDAICDYNEAIKLNTEYSLAYNNRGLAKYKLGKFQDAINDYDDAIKLNDEYSLAYSNRGFSKQKLGYFKDAISDYDEAIKLNIKSYEVYNNRGFSKQNLEKFQDAISDYDKAIKLNPKSSLTYHNRGFSKSKLSKFQDAISDYNEAIRLNTKYSLAYNNRGIAHYSLDKLQDAIKDYNKVIEFNPQNANAYSARGFAKDKLGDTQDAKDDFAKAKKLNPKFEIPDFLSDNSNK